MNDETRAQGAGSESPGEVPNNRVTDLADIPTCYCHLDVEVYLAGGWIKREARDRRCHPDQLSEWAQEGIRRHDERRRRAQAFMNDPANAEAVAIIRAMLNGGVIS